MVRLSVDDGAAELVTSMLWDAGTTGIVELDGGLLAGFDDRSTADAVAERARAWPVTVVAVEPNRWAGTDDVTTVTVGADRTDASSASRTLEIVAGPTFGHGGHPTTALAIDLLGEAVGERIAAGRRPSVLDVGTGSGVLAIAAAALGARPVVGLDIDPEAIPVARANATRNGVEVTVTGTTVAEAVGLVGGAGFDLVVANVLVPAQRELAPAMAAVIAPGGSLITTGYLEADGADVVALHRLAAGAADRAALSVGAERHDDGWLGHRFDLADGPV